jgi:hypothetical protein
MNKFMDNLSNILKKRIEKDSLNFEAIPMNLAQKKLEIESNQDVLDAHIFSENEPYTPELVMESLQEDLSYLYELLAYAGEFDPEVHTNRINELRILIELYSEDENIYILKDELLDLIHKRIAYFGLDNIKKEIARISIEIKSYKDVYNDYIKKISLQKDILN